MSTESEHHIPALHVHRHDTASHEKKRRRRTRPHEVNILMSAYVRNAFPSENKRSELARMVGMSTRAVSVWFQNRRQAEKKRSQRYQSSSALSAPTHSVPFLAPVFPPREPFTRSQSTPSVSLMTTTAGRAALRECPTAKHQPEPPMSCTLDSTRDGHGIITGDVHNDDRAIWQRMESSSALGSCSSEANDELHTVNSTANVGMDEDDDEERTLRRLAQRRTKRLMERKRTRSLDDMKRHESDARLVMHENMNKRRCHSFQRKPSLRLEMAADGNLHQNKENVPPNASSGVRMQRVHSMPNRPLQELTLHNSAPSFVNLHVQPQQPPRRAPLMSRRPLNRRAISATSHMPNKLTTNWTRTSSARSCDMLPLVGKETSSTEKEPVHDDSGFFDDNEQAESCSPPNFAQPQHVLVMLKDNGDTDGHAWTEHDRQAAELLLGLGGGNSQRAWHS